MPFLVPETSAEMTPGEKPTVATQQSIILVAAPGLLRNALQNLLSTFAGVDTLVLTSDLASALSAIEKHAPTLILVDAELLVDERELAQSVMATTLNGSKLLLLAADVAQGQLADPHQNHEVLLKGVRPEVLSDRIESILGSFAG